ncbi:MAG TPA: hypothetical protein VJ696_12475, partial [Rhodanobacteraceae bacterium]|nr:hypothetical protein [Rhodanobacteraceae bacterium]
MTSGIRGVAIGGCILALGIAAGIFARADDGGTSIASLKAGILTQKPQTKVAKVDRERLVVRRIDVVDEAGTIRMTLASPAPAPIVDGIQYKRAFPTAGLTVFDKDGNERGGFGVADIEGGAAVAAQDHVNGDAIGWRIMPDGSISFVMNERGAIRREPALGNHIVPTMESASRIQMSVAADGTPAIALSDKASRPRLRLTVNE